MSKSTLTALVYNPPNAKQLGVPEFYYRKRACDTNLTASTPANQYQRLKLIQNTVRVYASLYAANKAPLVAYRQPTAVTHGVCWNQMSDRPFPSVQRASIPTGTNNALNRKHISVTSSKPGCQTPGGAGVDIKHNSYDRYLNRLKGKGPLKRGYIAPTFGAPIPFTPADPIYGGKTTKTNIVTAGCNCLPTKEQAQLPYVSPVANAFRTSPYPSTPMTLRVGDYIYVKSPGTYFYQPARIMTILYDDSTPSDYLVLLPNGATATVPAATAVYAPPRNTNCCPTQTIHTWQVDQAADVNYDIQSSDSNYLLSACTLPDSIVLPATTSETNCACAEQT